ncbi:MAG: leucine-rich repeat protein [Elusimicrobia bacterium]|nr:leucine-rich repeat protein [Elusimicrobiota bacterium]
MAVSKWRKKGLTQWLLLYLFLYSVNICDVKIVRTNAITGTNGLPENLWKKYNGTGAQFYKTIQEIAVKGVHFELSIAGIGYAEFNLKEINYDNWRKYLEEHKPLSAIVKGNQKENDAAATLPSTYDNFILKLQEDPEFFKKALNKCYPDNINSTNEKEWAKAANKMTEERLHNVLAAIKNLGENWWKDDVINLVKDAAIREDLIILRRICQIYYAPVSEALQLISLAKRAFRKVLSIKSKSKKVIKEAIAKAITEVAGIFVEKHGSQTEVEREIRLQGVTDILKAIYLGIDEAVKTAGKAVLGIDKISEKVFKIAVEKHREYNRSHPEAPLSRNIANVKKAEILGYDEYAGKVLGYYRARKGLIDAIKDGDIKAYRSDYQKILDCAIAIKQSYMNKQIDLKAVVKKLAGEGKLREFYIKVKRKENLVALGQWDEILHSAGDKFSIEQKQWIEETADKIIAAFPQDRQKSILEKKNELIGDTVPFSLKQYAFFKPKRVEQALGQCRNEGERERFAQDAEDILYEEATFEKGGHYGSTMRYPGPNPVPMIIMRATNNEAIFVAVYIHEIIHYLALKGIIGIPASVEIVGHVLSTIEKAVYDDGRKATEEILFNAGLEWQRNNPDTEITVMELNQATHDTIIQNWERLGLSSLSDAQYLLFNETAGRTSGTFLGGIFWARSRGDEATALKSAIAWMDTFIATNANNVPLLYVDPDYLIAEKKGLTEKWDKLRTRNLIRTLTDCAAGHDPNYLRTINEGIRPVWKKTIEDDGWTLDAAKKIATKGSDGKWDAKPGWEVVVELLNTRKNGSPLLTIPGTYIAFAKELFEKTVSKSKKLARSWNYPNDINSTSEIAWTKAKNSVNGWSKERRLAAVNWMHANSGDWWKKIDAVTKEDLPQLTQEQFNQLINDVKILRRISEINFAPEHEAPELIKLARDVWNAVKEGINFEKALELAAIMFVGKHQNKSNAVRDERIEGTKSIIRAILDEVNKTVDNIFGSAVKITNISCDIWRIAVEKHKEYNIAHPEAPLTQSSKESGTKKLKDVLNKIIGPDKFQLEYRSDGSYIVTIDAADITEGNAKKLKALNIKIALTGVKEWADYMAVIAENIEELELTQVKDIAFIRGLKQLRKLKISDSKIEDLSLLAKITSLESIELEKLGKLRNLSLSEHMKIQSVKLKNLRNLEMIDLSFSGIQKLDLGEGLRELEELNLRSCKNLKSLKLENLSSLENIDLQESGIETLELGADLGELKNLDFSWCSNLRNLKLENLNSLEWISLRASGIEKLELGEGLEKLEELKLNKCKTLKSLKLENLSSLGRIALENSGIETLELGEGLGELEELDLSECKNLRSLKLRNLSSLENIDLQESGIETLELGEGLGELKVLDLPFCENLKSLKLENLSSLENIDLQESGIEKVKLGEGLGELEELNLRSCENLKNLKLENLSSLEEIDLQASGIETLELGEGLRELKVLDLHLCENLKSLKLENLSSLEAADLEDSGIETLKVGKISVKLGKFPREYLNEMVSCWLLLLKKKIIDSPKKIWDDLVSILNLSSGVEKRILSAIKELSPMIEKYPQSWNELIKPIIYNQTQGAFLSLEAVKKLYDMKAIQTDKDMEFIKTLIMEQSFGAYNTLKNFIIKGIEGKEKIITLPFSVKEGVTGQEKLTDEAIKIMKFLKEIEYPILEVYKVYKDPARKKEKEGLLSRCRNIHKKIMDGDVSEVEKDPLFVPIQYYVLSPEATMEEAMYENLNETRPDRKEDTKALERAVVRWKPIQWRKFEASVGNYKLKDPSEPLNSTPWGTILKVVKEVNKEEKSTFKEEEKSKLGKELIEILKNKDWSRHGEEDIKKWENKREEIIKQLYRLYRSNGFSLPENLNTIEHIMNHKQFVGDTLRDLINEAVNAYRKGSETNEKYYQESMGNLYRTKIKDPAKGAKIILGILKNEKIEEPVKKERIGGILGIEEGVLDMVWEKIKEKKELGKIEEVLSGIEFKIQQGKEALDLAQVLQGEEYKQMQGEVNAKYEFNEGKDKLKLRFLVSKRKGHGVAGYNMGVCVAPDKQLWNNPNFMNAIIWDEKGLAMGGFHILIIENEGKRYLTLPGINPSSKLLAQVAADSIFDEIIKYAHDVAKVLKCEEVLIPSNSTIHSNRSEIQRVIASREYEKKMLKEIQPFSYSPYKYEFQECLVVPPIKSKFWKNVALVLREYIPSLLPHFYEKHFKKGEVPTGEEKASDPRIKGIREMRKAAIIPFPFYGVSLLGLLVPWGAIIIWLTIIAVTIASISYSGKKHLEFNREHPDKLLTKYNQASGPSKKRLGGNKITNIRQPLTPKQQLDFYSKPNQEAILFKKAIKTIDPLNENITALEKEELVKNYKKIIENNLDLALIEISRVNGDRGTIYIKVNKNGMPEIIQMAYNNDGKTYIKSKFDFKKKISNLESNEQAELNKHLLDYNPLGNDALIMSDFDISVSAPVFQLEYTSSYYKALELFYYIYMNLTGSGEIREIENIIRKGKDDYAYYKIPANIEVIVINKVPYIVGFGLKEVERKGEQILDRTPFDDFNFKEARSEDAKRGIAKSELKNLLKGLIDKSSFSLTDK